MNWTVTIDIDQERGWPRLVQHHEKVVAVAMHFHKRNLQVFGDLETKETRPNCEREGKWRRISWHGSNDSTLFLPRRPQRPEQASWDTKGRDGVVEGRANCDFTKS